MKKSGHCAQYNHISCFYLTSYSMLDHLIGNAIRTTDRNKRIVVRIYIQSILQQIHIVRLVSGYTYKLHLYVSFNSCNVI